MLAYRYQFTVPQTSTIGVRRAEFVGEIVEQNVCFWLVGARDLCISDNWEDVIGLMF